MAASRLSVFGGLSGLGLRHVGLAEQCDGPAAATAAAEAVNDAKGSKVECTVCCARFDCLEEHRAHVRSSNWHAYNMRQIAREQRGEGPASLAFSLDEFNEIKSAGEKKVEKRDAEDDGSSSFWEGIASDPSDERKIALCFDHTDNKWLSVHAAILRDSARRSAKIDRIGFLNGLKELSGHTSWAVFLVSGGRFSGAIFLRKGLGDRENIWTCTHHKSFARYTTRRKQGGSQAARDNVGGQHTSSAGASIRRHNEKKLKEETLALLLSWKSAIETCDRIFVYAPSRNKDVLYQKDSPIKRNDPRIRTVPLSVARPTTNEAKRVFYRLSTADIISIEKPDVVREQERIVDAPIGQNVEIPKRIDTINHRDIVEGSDSDDSESQLRCYGTAVMRALSEKKGDLKSSIDSLEEGRYIVNGNSANERGWSSRFLAACKRAGLDSTGDWATGILATALDAAIRTGKINAALYLLSLSDAVYEVDWQNEQWHYRTCLHRASYHCHDLIVRRLLELNADPLIKGVRNQRPYNLARSLQTRRAFIEFAKRNPSKWDWESAGITIATTDSKNEQEESDICEDHAEKVEVSRDRTMMEEKEEEYCAKKVVGGSEAANDNTGGGEDQDEDDDQTEPSGPSNSSGKSRKPRKNRTKKKGRKYKKQEGSERPTRLESMIIPEDIDWACGTCTFRNESSASMCAVCNAPKLKRENRREKQSTSAEWTCQTCTYLNIVEGDNATCRMCGAQKVVYALAANSKRRIKKKDKRNKRRSNNEVVQNQEPIGKDKTVNLPQNGKDGDGKQAGGGKNEQKGNRLGGNTAIRRSRLLDSIPRKGKT